MDTLALIWTAAPDVKVKLLLLAMAAQMALTIKCYMQMSDARVSAAKAGRVTTDMYKSTDNEPEDLRVYTRAVANQFELPVMFYAIIIAGIAASMSSWISVVLAWLFVFLRYLHVQEMLATNVLKRRKVFIYGMQVFLLMALDFIVSILFFATA